MNSTHYQRGNPKETRFEFFFYKTHALSSSSFICEAADQLSLTSKYLVNHNAQEQESVSRHILYEMKA